MKSSNSIRFSKIEEQHLSCKRNHHTPYTLAEEENADHQERRAGHGTAACSHLLHSLHALGPDLLQHDRVQTERGYFNRNPLSPIEAIHIDYASPPAPIGTRTIHGLLTAPDGVPMGTGRYFARVTDNDDGDGDPLVDSDSVVILRVMGVHRGSAAEGSVYGTNTQNAIATIETTLRRDTTLTFDEAFTVYGPNVDITYNGNSFDLDGRHHDLGGNLIAGVPKPGLGLMNHNPGAGNAAVSAASAFTMLAGMQMDNLVWGRTVISVLYPL